MDTTERMTIAIYPWATPSAEQRKEFDALPSAEKRRLISLAIENGFGSGIGEKSVESVIEEARADIRHAS